VVFAESNGWSFAETAIVQLGVVFVALIPIFFMLGRNHKLGLKTYRHINGIEEAEAVPNGDGENPPTLGSVVRDVQEEVKSGFKHNDETHEAIIETVKAQNEVLKNHGVQLEDQADDIKAVRREIEIHHPKNP
jgi:hypothetical protein